MKRDGDEVGWVTFVYIVCIGTPWQCTAMHSVHGENYWHCGTYSFLIYFSHGDMTICSGPAVQSRALLPDGI